MPFVKTARGRVAPVTKEELKKTEAAWDSTIEERTKFAESLRKAGPLPSELQPKDRRRKR